MLPMEEDKIVKKINESPFMAYVAVTGGGVSFTDRFLGYGGGSKTILGFEVPYGKDFLIDFLESGVDKFVCPDTARKMAAKAFEKARKHNSPEFSVGIGCTASLATTDEREGREHRFFLCFHSHSICRTYSVKFKVGLERKLEESILCSFILRRFHDFIFGNFGKEGLLDFADRLDMEAHTVNLSEKRDVVDLFLRKRDLYFNKEHVKNLLSQDRVVVFPGSFNPIHFGHIRMFEMAREITGIDPIFEISILNIDKPSLSIYDIQSRHDQLVNYPLIMTSGKFIADKAKIIRDNFPPLKTIDGFDKRIDFVIGLDTWERFVNSPNRNLEPVLRYHRVFYDNVGFIVFNRGGKTIDRDHYGFKNVTFIDGFNMDISSTKIRNQNYDY
jgi:nicotinic acid mononucleotide adenylyltransferase